VLCSFTDLHIADRLNVDFQIADRQNVDFRIADIKMWTSLINLSRPNQTLLYLPDLT
jgi:hypothetical protein